jgi:hypothetical protein
MAKETRALRALLKGLGHTAAQMQNKWDMKGTSHFSCEAGPWRQSRKNPHLLTIFTVSPCTFLHDIMLLVYSMHKKRIWIKETMLCVFSKV